MKLGFGYPVGGLLFHPLLFFASHYLFIGVVALLAFGFGRKLCPAVSYDSLWEEISFCTAIGLAAIAYVVLGLALLHLLYRGVALACLVAIAGYVSRDLLDQGWRAYRAWQSFAHKRLSITAAAALVLLCVPILVMPLYPPTTWDALMYHLPIAKLDVQRHALAFSPYIRYPAFPETTEMLFTLALLLFDDVSAQLVHFVFMLLLAMSLLAWGKRVYNLTAGAWAAALWLSNPFVLYFGSAAYIDMAVALYVCLGAYAFSNWTQTRRPGWILISGIVFGVAAASKYSALAPLCAFGLVLLYLTVKHKRVRPLALFVGAVALIAAPWYIRNVYYTRNPVWPYFGSLFGYGGPWSAADMAAFIRSQRTYYGPGISVKALLLLPWDLSFRLLQVYLQEAPVNLSAVYFFCLIPAVIFAIRNKYARALLIGVGAYTLFWFFSIQIIRLLLPAIAVLGVVTMAAAAHYAGKVPGLRKLSPRLLAASGTFLLILPGWSFAAHSWRKNPLPVTAGQREAYLRSYLPPYPAYEWLNREYGDRYVLYAPGDEEMTYYTDGHLLGDWFGPSRCTDVIPVLGNSRKLYEEMANFGADFLLLNEDDFRPAALRGLPWAEGDFFRSHFRLVWAAPSIQLFQISRQPVHPVPEVELIRDPGLEALARHERAWRLVGSPVVDSTGNHSHGGKTAVRLTPKDRLVQRVRIEPCHIYRLSDWTTADAPQQRSRLQINWRTGKTLLRADIEFVMTSSGWTRREMPVMAPPGAQWADVYVHPQDGSQPIWFDDVSLVAIGYVEHNSLSERNACIR